MAIQMIGIDHTKAVIDIRTIFSFTKKRSAEALKLIKEEKGIWGCVLISTCNRMELYVSTEEGYEGDLYELLCRVPCRSCSRRTQRNWKLWDSSILPNWKNCCRVPRCWTSFRSMWMRN